MDFEHSRGSHFQHWPPLVPRHLTLPQTNLFYNAEVSAARYPDKPFIVFYDTAVSFAEFKDEAERMAGFLQHECGVKAGDRVLLYMQNSPQWVLAFYGILQGVAARALQGNASSAQAIEIGKRTRPLADQAWALAQRIGKG